MPPTAVAAAAPAAISAPLRDRAEPTSLPTVDFGCAPRRRVELRVDLVLRLADDPLRADVVRLFVRPERLLDVRPERLLDLDRPDRDCGFVLAIRSHSS